jgi:ribosomal protein S18 acetylase RimI-like enzyme
MTMTVRRLGAGDEPVLELLSRDGADFDLADRDEPQAPLAPDDARAHLADASLLHWVAEDGGAVVGFMYCHVLRLRAREPREVLLYEIGVRQAHRRQRVGRALVDALYAWMAEHGVQCAWVLADNPGAVEFYRACGFTVEQPAPVYLTVHR